MNRNQIVTITSTASAPPTQVQHQTRSGVLYAGADPVATPRARARPRCKHYGQLRKGGHATSDCPNVDHPIPEVPRQRTPRMVSSGPPSEDNWDHVHALLHAHPKSVVTIAMAQEDLASEKLVGQEHGYAVKLIYPEDSWEDPGQGFFILARSAAALNGTYNRVRKAAKGGTSLTTIVREESHKSPGSTIESVVDAMKELDVGGSTSQGSRRPRKSRKKRST